MSVVRLIIIGKERAIEVSKLIALALLRARYILALRLSNSLVKVSLDLYLLVIVVGESSLTRE